MLALVIASATQLHAETGDVQAALAHAATHAWIEGHIEGEDTCPGCRYRGDAGPAERLGYRRPPKRSDPAPLEGTPYRWGAPGTPLFPARLRHVWRGTRVPRRVADKLGLPRPTTLDVARFPKQYDRRLFRMIAKEVNGFVRDPRVGNLLLLVDPIDGAHLDDAPMSDRSRNLVKRAAWELSTIEWLMTHTVDDLLDARLVGVLTVLEVLTGLEALEKGGRHLGVTSA